MEVRTKLYELLTHCIPPTVVLKVSPPRSHPQPPKPKKSRFGSPPIGCPPRSRFCPSLAWVPFLSQGCGHMDRDCGCGCGSNDRGPGIFYADRFLLCHFYFYFFIYFLCSGPQTIAERVTDKVDESLKGDVVHWAAFYVRRRARFRLATYCAETSLWADCSLFPSLRPPRRFACGLDRRRYSIWRHGLSK